MGTSDYLDGKWTSMIFYNCFAHGIRNDDNTRTKFPFDLNFFLTLCSSELNSILLVPNKDITHFIMIFYIFVPFMGMGVARTALENFSRLRTFFGVS